MSHSQGAGSVSSKSLASKTRRRSGRGEEAEVGDVGVAAGLHDDVRPRRTRRGRGPSRRVCRGSRRRATLPCARGAVAAARGVDRPPGARGRRWGRGRFGVRTQRGSLAAPACGAGGPAPRVPMGATQGLAVQVSPAGGVGAQACSYVAGLVSLGSHGLHLSGRDRRFLGQGLVSRSPVSLMLGASDRSRIIPCGRRVADGRRRPTTGVSVTLLSCRSQTSVFVPRTSGAEVPLAPQDP